MKQTVYLPPDGGYGWVIVMASALNNFIAIPITLNYGMVFINTFTDLGMSAVEASLIVNVNAAFGMLTGLINGPLLNNFGYRKISLVGAFLMTSGVFLLSYARTWTSYILCYGLMASLGVGLTISSYSLAINTYFMEKRNKAVSLCMTITGMGPIIMPQVINYLLEHYDPTGVILILSGVCAQSFIAGTLLQPVKYHMKKETKEIVKSNKDTVEEENEREEFEEIDEDEVYHTLPAMKKIIFTRTYSQNDRIRRDSTKSMFYEQEAAGLYGIDSTLVGTSIISLESVRFPTLVRQNTKTKYQWWMSASTVNLESSYNIFEEKSPQEDRVYNQLSYERKKDSRLKRIFRRIVVFFDLELIKDLTYCNILLGISVAMFAELSFSLLTVFILNEYGTNTTQTAQFLSIVGTADIIFRFLSPYIGDLIQQPPRVIYLLTLIALVVIRSVLFLVNDTTYLFGFAAALGCIKGVRIVYMYLVIPNYVPLDRLASACGIQMVSNGIVIFTGGLLIGFVKDLTGSYQSCILVINIATSITIVLWLIEFAFRGFRKKIGIADEKSPPQADVLLNSTTTPNVY